ncbi:MAG: ABC transporter ATP-binding protein [Myxococcota bacterium]|nr:ABC transporter ATP-binding protein [Myxococcota bacterium]
MSQKLLQVHHLTAVFSTDNGVIYPVRDVSFDIAPGETVALVGESGSGKSLTALSLLGLVPSPGRISGGRVFFEGQDLLLLSKRALRTIRGNEMSIVFQDPEASLNPVRRIGDQIAEAILVHADIELEVAELRALEMLRQVGLPSPEERLAEYPFQLSGGMQQRVLIAMALVTRPKLLIADEPTTNLDPVMRVQLLALFGALARDLGLAVMLITHDLSVIPSVVDRVMVMYAGEIVEVAPTETLLATSRHPYTLGLLGSIPNLDGTVVPLEPIPGQVPNLEDLPTGCVFHPRCAFCQPICHTEHPNLEQVAGTAHMARCWLNDPDVCPNGWDR